MPGTHLLTTAALDVATTQGINEIMALAIQGSGGGIWDRNVVTGDIHYFDGWAEMLGYGPHEISSRIEDSYKRVQSDDLPYVQAAISDHFEGRTPFYEAEHRLLCKDGTYKWVLSRGCVVSRDAQGHALRMMGTTTDISSMRLLAERLHQTLELMTNLTNEVPGLVFQCRRHDDGSACVTYASARIDEIYELAPEQVANTTAPIHERIHPDDRLQYLTTLRDATARQEPWFCMFRVLLPVRGLRWRQVDATPTRLEDGETLWHGLVVDVTERKHQEQELINLARIDTLTGLPNRRTFNERIEGAWEALNEELGRRVMVLMIDIDHFKAINDHYGHAAGDAVLRHVGSVLRGTLRVTDNMGRLGGEEFAACLYDIDLRQAHVVAERLRLAIAENPVPFAGRNIPVTVSIGVSEMCDTDVSSEDALARADMALYTSKKDGRDRVSIAAPTQAH